MLQDMDYMEACCGFSFKVGRFDPLEQSKICVLTVTWLRIVMLKVLATVLDLRFRCRAGSEPNRCEIGSWGSQMTRTVDSGPVQ